MRLIFFLILTFVLSFDIKSQTLETVCAGDSATFTIVCSGGVAPYTVKWTKPNGDTVTTAQLVTSIAGVYTWQCKDATTCSPKSGTHTLSVEPNPTDSLVIVAENKCINTPQTISVSGVPAGYTYSWNFGSGAVPATSTAQSANVTYSTSGTKIITITISKLFTGVGTNCNNTCKWTKTKNIIIGGLNGSINCN